MENLPKGTWFIEQNNQTIVGATTRSPIGYFLVPFMCLFTAGAIGGLYGVQFADGESESLMNLIGVAFIISILFFWGFTIMAIWGKVEITVNDKGGRVFTGIKNLGLSKRFCWDEISTVNEKKSSSHYPGSQGYHIVLDGKRRISFGMGISGVRREFLIDVLQKSLEKAKAKE